MHLHQIFTNNSHLNGSYLRDTVVCIVTMWLAHTFLRLGILSNFSQAYMPSYLLGKITFNLLLIILLGCVPLRILVDL